MVDGEVDSKVGVSPSNTNSRGMPNNKLTHTRCNYSAITSVTLAGMGQSKVYQDGYCEWGIQ